MKKVLLSLFLILGISSSSYAATETSTIVSKTDSRKHARCAFVAKALRMDKSEISRHIKMAMHNLDQEDMIFEAGYIAGIAYMISRYEYEKSEKQVAKEFYAVACRKQQKT